VLDDTGRIPFCNHDVVTENWVLTGCTSKGEPYDGAVDPTQDSDTHEGPSINGPPGFVLGTVTFLTQPDLLERIRPTKDNGARADLLDENCEAADVYGSPYNAFVEEDGSTDSPSGGLTADCKDAFVTIRMLEGDIDLNCAVDLYDDQLIAFSYGLSFGSSGYDPFLDLEPATFPPDWDVDIKDVQFVFGRNGSTCEDPIPNQEPQPSLPDP
jgi:hypothetical protein